MKKLFVVAALAMLAGSAMAQVSIAKNELGSAVNAVDVENAKVWSNDIYHAPQYMPGYPTSAVIFPRVVDVECASKVLDVSCKGYNWSPAMGRGEYLMFRPVVKAEPAPKVVTIIKEIPGPVREVLVEVPVKKKGE